MRGLDFLRGGVDQRFVGHDVSLSERDSCQACHSEFPLSIPCTEVPLMRAVCHRTEGRLSRKGGCMRVICHTRRSAVLLGRGLWDPKKIYKNTHVYVDKYVSVSLQLYPRCASSPARGQSPVTGLRRALQIHDEQHHATGR